MASYLFQLFFTLKTIEYKDCIFIIVVALLLLQMNTFFI